MILYHCDYGGICLCRPNAFPVVQGPFDIINLQNVEVTEEEDEENEMFRQFQSLFAWNLFSEGKILWYPEDIFLRPLLKMTPLCDASPVVKIPLKCYNGTYLMTPETEYSAVSRKQFIYELK